ncbi:MAG: glycosyltransferase family 4 protein [Ginsengibacter sp.]
MSIIIFGDLFTFPDGNAATNRVYTYAKGFIENGVNTHVICFESAYNTSGDGITNGIYYYHPFGQQERNKYFLVRRWLKLKKHFRAIQLVKEINRKDKVTAIISYSTLLQFQVFSSFLSKIIKSKVILECSEHPLKDYQDSYFKKIAGKSRVYIESKLYNGINCISQYLIDFYEKIGVNQKKLFLVPSTVDTERFEISHDSPFPFKYIAYCGTLTQKKDGVNILIESFSRIAEKYPDINLVLIGKDDLEKDEILIKTLVTTLKLEKRIFFLGQISREKVPLYLANAKILVLARPRSLQADAGFPSKLTEYLATGVPIVVTEVGEISTYLKDNKNAFISEPDNAEAFAGKLDFVLENYPHAREIGLKGKELTKTVFNYNYQAKRMIDFIETL